MLRRFSVCISSCLLILLAFWGSLTAFGQADYKKAYDDDNLPDLLKAFEAGRYDIVLNQCEYALRRGQKAWQWRSYQMKALAEMGSYEEAGEVAELLLQNYPSELGALLDAHDMFRRLGKKEKRDEALTAINAAAKAVPSKDRDGLDYVHLGKAAHLLGADPQVVIDQYFAVAKAKPAQGKKIPPGLVEAHFASGELALEKNDYKLAASEFQAALRYDPDNPLIRFGLAKAFLPGDRETGVKHLDKVLEDSEFHFGALLIKAEHAINYEQYELAAKYLRTLLSINPRLPEAHAYLAVIAHLEKNDTELFAKERKLALQIHQSDPEIDHLIGRVLSRNYRFQEGAASQLNAIQMDPNFLPAKLQLASDYLRLGQEEEAWKLARAVGKADTYNVQAYNLELLENEIKTYQTISSPHFTIRMPEREVALYGDRAYDLLEEARKTLGEKYGLEIEKPVLVEFFPNQADFAIRSFGSLGGQGLLGVCFGTVVTMNSPGSVASGKNNWEATLWHEYCHVITLTLTKNKMPRWLSEGISVYEEMQRDPTWGQRMTPQYRKMILEENALTPISELSQAFYNAKSGMHVMFAYYESMLVVEYIVQKYGFGAMKKILQDLAAGVLINDAIETNTTAIAQLEEGFRQHVENLAANLGKGIDWSTPDPATLDARNGEALLQYTRQNPKNFWAKRQYTEYLLGEKQWEPAVKAAEKMILLYPEYTGDRNGYVMKAKALRSLGKVDQEALELERLASQSSEAFTSYTRLLDVHFEGEDWAEVDKNANRTMSINPFQRRLHFCQGCAREALNQPAEAVKSFEKSLTLGVHNSSEVRFRLARLLSKTNQEQAKKYLLDSLADSPRYREAHRLLSTLPVEEADR